MKATTILMAISCWHLQGLKVVSPKPDWKGPLHEFAKRLGGAKLEYLKLGVFLTTLLCSPAAADRFRVEQDILFFDMGYAGAEGAWPDELKQSDVGQFMIWIADYENVDTIAVTGPGGFGPAGREIAETIITFKFDTVAYGDCASACANIFMAGTKRRLTADAQLGFHRPYVIADEEKAYYEYARDGQGWQEEFDYVPHIYDVALTDMLGIVEYMTSRGIALDFILEAYSHSSFKVWEPDHSRLLKAGVITSIDYVDFDAQRPD